MATTEETVQLATRIPKRLHRAVKVHCVQHGIPVQEFCAAALVERLKKAQGKK